MKYISARPSTPKKLLSGLGAALVDGWLLIAGASVRAALVLPILVGPYRRLPALHGAPKIRPDVCKTKQSFVA